MSVPIMNEGKDANPLFNNYVQKLFRARIRAHRRANGEIFKTSLARRPKYFFSVMGLMLAALLFLFIMLIKHHSTPKEVYRIYYSAILFLNIYQFTIPYYLQPADLIHFQHERNYILKMRKYSIIHSVFYHMSNWFFLFLFLSPLYFTLFHHSIYHYISLYFFNVTLSLVTSLIRKEIKINLKRKSRFWYVTVAVIIALFFYSWHIMIFCFADSFFVYIGTIVNVSILFYFYKWGSKVIMSTLGELVEYDKQTNISSNILVNYFGKNKLKVPNSSKEKVSLFKFYMTREEINVNLLLFKLTIKYLIKVRSYRMMMGHLLILIALSLLLVESWSGHFIVTCITLVVSYFIHRQHLDYFCNHRVMDNSSENRIHHNGFQIKLTLLITLPILVVMSVVFYTII